MSQPFFVAEIFTGTPKKFVEFGNHYSDFDEMLSETFDDIPSPFLHGKRLGGRQGTSCELGRGHCE